MYIMVSKKKNRGQYGIYYQHCFTGETLAFSLLILTETIIYRATPLYPSNVLRAKISRRALRIRAAGFGARVPAAKVASVELLALAGAALGGRALAFQMGWDCCFLAGG